jgi:hypothetical protein
MHCSKMIAACSAVIGWSAVMASNSSSVIRLARYQRK